PTTVRVSRKSKQQYVATDKNGKTTGWSAFYIDGKWVEKAKESVVIGFCCHNNKNRSGFHWPVFLCRKQWSGGVLYGRQ
ncbi:hypothetical protein F9881_19830, partial [Morganella morganii]